ncbi:MAG: NADH dehydrogenase [Candidatus Melainabacteria bacterium RIFOXYA12_FULL_32_12]|nr:MAG: NADH dehydrogenase [Candidatus Melainabacteria bacterium RIFOXYA12_FULL_32_12]
MISAGTCSIAAGAKDVIKVFIEEFERNGINNIKIKQAGCMGLCHVEPTLEIALSGMPSIIYGNVTADIAKKIVEEHIINKKVLTDYTQDRPANDIISEKQDNKSEQKQFRIVLRNCGIIDPENIDEYITRDGYSALKKAIFEMNPDTVIEELKKSGLRGRGGAGFPTWMKWNFSKEVESEIKYIVCNADEGDPGAYMDRSTLEGDPHSVLEAMAIAGYTIGAKQGFIYIRAEYPLAIKRLEIAIQQATQYGLLGNNILGSDFSFDIEIRLGAGAFVCGEETALLASIEGERGMPRPRPPFPAIKGLWGQPTIINNVETYANIPVVILKGGEWFSKIGTETSKGTKVFALTGKINNSGLIEVPMGTTLREIVFDIGQGIRDGKQFKAVQTGGPSGGVIRANYLDTPIDYESLKELGSMMGSGGMIVMDEDDCMVDVSKFYLQFTVDESCGKCTPCRIGGRQILDILEKICSGTGTKDDIEKIKLIGQAEKSASLCGLGQTAPNPVLSTLHYFNDEYMEHIEQKKCRSGKCKKLVTYSVIAEQCIKCGLCARNCPVDCISGEIKKSPFVIDQPRCVKCGNCYSACPVSAVSNKSEAVLLANH